MSKKDTPIEGEHLSHKKEWKYHPDMCPKIIEVAKDGGHVAQMCLELDIKSRDTFYRWVDEFPEFKEAYETSKLYSQAFYENLLLAGACGRVKNYNFSSLAMILNNKFPDDYKRSANGVSGTEINIGSINSIEQLDAASLDKKILSLQKKLNMIPDVSIEDDLNEHGED